MLPPLQTLKLAVEEYAQLTGTVVKGELGGPQPAGLVDRIHRPPALLCTRPVACACVVACRCLFERA